MTRTKMSDKPNPNPDKALYTEPCAHDVRTNRIYGQLQDICTGVYAPERINQEYTPQGIIDYPPQGGTNSGTAAKIDPETGHSPTLCNGHHHGAQRIRDDIHHMRFHSGLQHYPYRDGIEGLRTSLICILNIMSDMMDEMEKRDG